MNTVVVVALAIVGALAAPAEHAMVGKRAVVVGPVGAGETVSVIGAALRARGVVVLDDDERAGLDDDLQLERIGDRERARSHLMAARAAWRQLDFATATSESTAAIDEVLLLSRPEDHLDVLFDATIFLAALRLNDDVNDPQAQRALQLAARLEPERETLDPALHPPSRVAAFAAARAAALAADDVVVVATPRVPGGAAGAQNGVELVVDGVVQAATGGLLHLQRGPHVLTVRGASGAARSRILDVTDGSAIDDVVVDTANLQLRRRLVTALRTGDTSVMPALLSACGVEALIVVDVAGTSAALRRGRAVTALPPFVADPTAFADAAIAVLDDVPDAVVRPVLPAAPPSVLTISAIGGAAFVAAALVGLTVYELLPGTPPAPPPRPVVAGCCVL